MSDMQQLPMFETDSPDEVANNGSGSSTRCRPGDLWQLGRHRLLCGDCTQLEAITRLMQGTQAQLGLHDPPYGLRATVKAGWDLWSGKRYGTSACAQTSFAPIVGDERPFDPQHLLTSGQTVVIWGANHFADKLPASHAWIIWDKRVDLPSNAQSDGEVAWVSHGNRLIILRHRWMGMIRDSERGERRVHPNQKPIRLMQEVIQRYTRPGDVIADWYAGSGTTLLAAECVKRIAYVCEIESCYCEVILRRYTALTGEKPVLLERGEEDRCVSRTGSSCV